MGAQRPFLDAFVISVSNHSSRIFLAPNDFLIFCILLPKGHDGSDAEGDGDFFLK